MKANHYEPEDCLKASPGPNPLLSLIWFLSVLLFSIEGNHEGRFYRKVLTFLISRGTSPRDSPDASK